MAVLSRLILLPLLSFGLICNAVLSCGKNAKIVYTLLPFRGYKNAAETRSLHNLGSLPPGSLFSHLEFYNVTLFLACGVHWPIFGCIIIPNEQLVLFSPAVQLALLVAVWTMLSLSNELQIPPCRRDRLYFSWEKICQIKELSSSSPGHSYLIEVF